MTKMIHTLALACSLITVAGHAVADTIPEIENAIITSDNANDACVLLLGASVEAEVSALSALEAMTAVAASNRCGLISADRQSFEI